MISAFEVMGANKNTPINAIAANNPLMLLVLIWTPP
jgi:hypothetical protein